MRTLLTTLVVLGAAHAALAQPKTQVKVGDIDNQEDTSIIVKKGDVQGNCTEYAIVDGKEEIFGAPDYDRSKAYAGWKTACNEFKAHMKELNKENVLLTLHCAQPQGTKEGDQWVFKSAGTYKIKTKVKEKSK